MAVVIAAALASLPAGASAEVVTPTAVKPEVVKPQAVTPPPTPAPSSAPAPNRGSGSAPTRSSSPSAEPVGDTPEPRQRGPRPAPVPTGEKPPFPTRPDYEHEGFPTCIANSGDTRARCKCDPAWCRYREEVEVWNRWQEEHADDPSAERAAAEAEAARAAAKDSILAAVEESIQAVITLKEMIERATRPPTPEEKCKCSIDKRGDSSSDPSPGYDGNSSPMGPPEPGVATATREVADTVAEAAGGLSKWFEKLLAE